MSVDRTSAALRAWRRLVQVQDPPVSSFLYLSYCWQFQPQSLVSILESFRMKDGHGAPFKHAGIST